MERNEREINETILGWKNLYFNDRSMAKQLNRRWKKNNNMESIPQKPTQNHPNIIINILFIGRQK